MTKKEIRNNKLQELCRTYLRKLRHMATKHGLSDWIDSTIKANANEECKATEHEVSILSRLVDDERISRTDVPKILGKSYRQCNDDGVFDKVKKLKHVGIYSKVSALLLKQNARQNVNKHE